MAAALGLGLLMSSLAWAETAPASREPAGNAWRVESVLQDPNGLAQGTSLDLTELLGQPIVLDFWATWCAPCLEGLPLWNQRVAEFQDRIHFVAITDELKPLDGFLKQHPMAGLVGVDRDRSVFEAFGVVGLPHTVLLDTDGTVHRVVQGVPTVQQLRELAGIESAENSIQSSPEKPTHRRELGLLEAEITPHAGGDRSYQMHGSGGIDARGMSVARAVRLAWGDQAYKFDFESHVPHGLYDIRIETRAGLGAVRAHLRLALEQLFGLDVEIVEREGDAYLLQGGPPGGAWLQKKGTDGERALLESSGGEIYLWRQVPAGQLAKVLEDWLGAPVMNETTLEGLWTAQLPISSSRSPELPDLLRKQWGLELVPVRREIPVAIVRVAAEPKESPGTLPSPEYRGAIPGFESLEDGGLKPSGPAPSVMDGSSIATAFRRPVEIHPVCQSEKRGRGRAARPPVAVVRAASSPEPLEDSDSSDRLERRDSD